MGDAGLVPIAGSVPPPTAVFRRRLRGDTAPICITTTSGGRPQPAYDLTGYRLRLRGSDPDFNFQRSARMLDNPHEGWDVKFLSSTHFEAAWVRNDIGDVDGATGLPRWRTVALVTGRYRWMPDRHTRWGSLVLEVESGLEQSASDFGRVLSLTINGDDPLATSSWGPLYATFDPAAFPSPGALAEHAQLQQTLQPVNNQYRYLSRDDAVRTTGPAPTLWTVGYTPETADFLRTLPR